MQRCSGDPPPLNKDEEIEKLKLQVLSLTKIIAERETSRGYEGGKEAGGSRVPSNRDPEPSHRNNGKGKEKEIEKEPSKSQPRVSVHNKLVFLNKSGQQDRGTEKNTKKMRLRPTPTA